MTLAVLHDLPGLENGLTKFHDFPGRVVTLLKNFSSNAPLSDSHVCFRQHHLTWCLVFFSLSIHFPQHFLSGNWHHWDATKAVMSLPQEPVSGWKKFDVQRPIPSLATGIASGQWKNFAVWLRSRKGIRPVKLSGEKLAWLSVWSEVQMICIWSTWCHCNPIIFCSSKIQNSLLSAASLPRLS